jgi:hypothetical protein
MRMKLLSLTTALVLVALLSVPKPAFADRFTTYVWSRMLDVLLILGMNDLSSTHDPFTSWIYNRKYEDVNFHLRRGRTYYIVGVCDQDCSDLDLAAYDSNGALISSDLRIDSTPVVSVTAYRETNITVRASMRSCNSSFCHYGLGAFSR